MKFQELAGLTDFALVIWVDAFSELMLNHLMNVTKEALASTSETHDMLQVTALHTTGEKIYTGISYGPQSGEQLIEKLKEQGDTQVTHLVAMWQQGGIDIPSFDFRQALIDLNEKNEFALLVMQGHDCLRTRTIGSTMPKKKDAE